MGAARPRASEGVVVAWDVEVGLGVVRAEDGVEVPFHCTQIADGSRDISLGAAVSFRLAAGRGGRWEAVAVRPRR